jgi:hypothetical protein
MGLVRPTGGAGTGVVPALFALYLSIYLFLYLYILYAYVYMCHTYVYRHILRQGMSGLPGQLNVCMRVLAGLPVCSADVVPMEA